MASFKIVISDPKTRKAYQREVDTAASGMLGKKLGERISGGPLGLEGYTLELTGGSDAEGLPMRKDVDGTARKRIVLSHPPGFHADRRGQRKRKSIRGNTISQSIVQVNAKVVEHGKEPIEKLLGVEKKAEKPTEGKKEEKPAAEKEAKREEKPSEKKEEKTEPKKEPGQEKAEEKMGVKKLE
jgi:small subunit ribosomal protein S6e